MAEDHNSGSPYEMLWFVAAIVGGLIVLWFVQGGPEKADLRGIFLNPPPPVGSGDAYGPQIGTSTYQQNQ